jgi:competence ComEA-like helix-hairpin-helix protein
MKEHHEKRDMLTGVLLLLFLLLLLNHLPAVLSKTEHVELDFHNVYGLKHDTFTSFNRITLGMSVSVNHADAESLTAIPGIGPKVAQRIVQERKQRGGFETLHELQSVVGIGAVLYEKIKVYLSL